MRSHDEVLQSTVAEAGGVLFKHTGDGVIAAFQSPIAALRAAESAQSQLGLPVRMGLHSGEAELRDGDYYGTTLNRAARVMDAGHGGQILASATTASLLGDVGTIVDLGLFELKGLDGAERVFQLGSGSFPALRARQAEVGNIPRDLTPFVGRAGELEQLVAKLDTDPIVTLFGVGGTGKTRLALEAARSSAAGFADGRWFVELSAVAVPEAVPFAVSSGVGMTTPDQGDVTEALVRRLAERQMLIIVDNCEHVVDGAADVIERIAAECPRVRVIATSREPLMIRGEQVVPVGPLPDSDSLELFLERARAESPGLVLDERQLGAVAALCRRIDGLPLAIELAAARVRSMTPVDLVAGLDERFRLLVGNRRSRTERHQTMRATLDWSYSLCDPVEQAVFDRLSVFPAEFGGPAAVAVAADDGLSSYDVLDAVARLVDRSLLVREAGDDGSSRFRMLETMRVYGREHLRDADQSDRVRERHARYVADEVNRLADLMIGPDERAALERVRALIADILLALDWYLEHDEIEQAMRLPMVAALVRPRECGAMVQRIHAAAEHVIVPATVRAELDLSRSAAEPAERNDSELATLTRQVSPQPNRHTVLNFPTLRSLSPELANELRDLADRFAATPLLTRHIVLVQCTRALIISGHLEGTGERLDSLQELAEQTGSEVLASAVIELRAMTARQHHDYPRAAALFDEYVQRRDGYLELTTFSILGRFHAIDSHVRAGDTVTTKTVQTAWDLFNRCGVVGPSGRAASATAIWLTTLDRRYLALRFLGWATHAHRESLAHYADTLVAFELPTAVDESPEPLEQLLDELDLV